MLDKETGELVERRLMHTEEARAFYEGLQGAVVVGVEASGNMDWFESLLARCQHQMWIGDAAAIARQEGRKQKHDRRAAALILKLMVENRFPMIWVPTVAERDLRQLLIHRQHLVRMRTRIKNQLQHVALNQGWQKKRKLWSQARAGVVAQPEAGTVDTAATRHVAGYAGGVGEEDSTSGPGGGQRSRSA